MTNTLKDPLYVLVIEDNHADFVLLSSLLAIDHVESEPFSFLLEKAATLKEALQILNRGGNCDIVLLDLGLPDAEGFQGLEAIKSYWPETPVIVLTGVGDREMSNEAVKRGADDFIVKGEISRNRIINALEVTLLRVRRNLAPSLLVGLDLTTRSDLLAKILECRAKRREIANSIREQRANNQ
jgi:DNA-binding NtrC family response regulator